MQKTLFGGEWTLTDETGAVKTVTVPHDAMFERARSADAEAGDAQGFYPGGSYTYEQSFEAPADWDGKRVMFQFEGVYQNARVFLNGQEAGGAKYGYIPFFVETEGLLKSGTNTIRVECENQTQPASRWYSGAGIYRPVWVWTGSKDAILPEGVRVTTKSLSPVGFEVAVETTGAGDEIEVSLTERGGSAVLASASAPVTDQKAVVSLESAEAKPWSAESPVLYEVKVSLKKNGEVVDETVEATGFRLLSWSTKGLLVNGKETLLKGGCIHHDNGVLGAKTFDEAEYRRVRILKEAGYNAIRMAHNPASRALITACDELGMYLMDESWDMWYNHKTKGDYATYWEENYLSDLAAMVSRGYNHPSIILWSIGNEVSEPAKEKGIQKTKEMVEYLHGLDGTRPVTGGFNLMIIGQAAKGKGVYDENGGGMNANTGMGGMNSTMYNMIVSMIGTGMEKAANSKKVDAATSPGLDALDIAGYNYGSGRYPMEAKAHPDRILVGSETFPQNIAKNWEMVKKFPYLVGDFMWTAWDYLGESGIGAWTYEKDGAGFTKPYPWKLANVGIFDIIGDADAQLGLVQAAWEVTDAPCIGVVPVNHAKEKMTKAAWRGSNAIRSWAWKGCDGRKCTIEIYADAASAEVQINGKSLGKKKLKNCKAVFKGVYEAGTVRAIAYDASGNVIKTSELSSATGALSLLPQPEKTTAAPGEVLFVPLSIAGENGVVEKNADTRVSVSVEGGELLGFGSANPRGEENYLDGAYTTWYGRAMAVVRAGEKGTVKVTFSATGYEDAAAQIEIG